MLDFCSVEYCCRLLAVSINVLLVFVILLPARPGSFARLPICPKPHSLLLPFLQRILLLFALPYYINIALVVATGILSLLDPGKVPPPPSAQQTSAAWRMPRLLLRTRRNQHKVRSILRSWELKSFRKSSDCRILQILKQRLSARTAATKQAFFKTCPPRRCLSGY